MLVLSRKKGEQIIIADNIIVEVRSIQGNRVKLAIDAERKTTILRGELKKGMKDGSSSRS